MNPRKPQKNSAKSTSEKKQNKPAKEAKSATKNKKRKHGNSDGDTANNTSDGSTTKKKQKVKRSDSEVNVTPLNSQATVKAPCPALEVITVDIGQGECAIVRVRGSKEDIHYTAVIDGGHKGASTHLRRILRNLKVEKIDLAVFTHFDGDHQDGLWKLLSEYHKDAESGMLDLTKCTVWVRTINPAHVQKTKGCNILKNLLKMALDKKICAVCVPKDNTQTFIDNGKVITLKIQCFTTKMLNKPLLEIKENDGSIGLLFSLNTEAHYYTAGDLPSSVDEGNGEDNFANALKEAWRTGQRVIKCGHHGSRFSTSKEFLEKVKPHLALIGSGNQSFSHPTIDVIDRLGDENIPICMTNCVYNRGGANLKAAELHAKHRIEIQKQFETKSESDDNEMEDANEQKSYDWVNHVDEKLKNTAESDKNYNKIQGWLRIEQHIAKWTTKVSNLGNPESQRHVIVASQMGDYKKSGHIYTKIDKNGILVQTASGLWRVAGGHLEKSPEQEDKTLKFLMDTQNNAYYHEETKEQSPKVIRRNSINDWGNTDEHGLRLHTMKIENFSVWSNYSSKGSAIRVCAHCEKASNEDDVGEVLTKDCIFCRKPYKFHKGCLALGYGILAGYSDKDIEQINTIEESIDRLNEVLGCSRCGGINDRKGAAIRNFIDSSSFTSDWRKMIECVIAWRNYYLVNPLDEEKSVMQLAQQFFSGNQDLPQKDNHEKDKDVIPSTRKSQRERRRSAKVIAMDDEMEDQVKEANNVIKALQQALEGATSNQAMQNDDEIRLTLSSQCESGEDENKEEMSI